jgi:hypothetical protein
VPRKEKEEKEETGNDIEDGISYHTGTPTTERTEKEYAGRVNSVGSESYMKRQ